MHIPLCETNELEILTFDEALETEKRGTSEYDVKKWIYVPNTYSEYGFFGVDKSQNTSCVPLISAEFFHSS